jgi:hypothetical protein
VGAGCREADVVRYFLSVGEGVLAALHERPVPTPARALGPGGPVWRESLIAPPGVVARRQGLRNDSGVQARQARCVGALVELN